MKAAICSAYGGPEVVQLREVERPRLRHDEYLIRVRASTVSSGDCRLRAANFPDGFGLVARMLFGLTRPNQPILGTECAGVIEEVGRAARQFKPGDEVIAHNGARFGCHAELVAIRVSRAIVAKPAGMTFAQGAAISFGGLTALHFLRGPGRLQRGERVLVNGASSCVGVAAVQLARHFGAHVTGVCSGAKVELVRSLGADAVIDYQSADFANTDERWDVIVDTAGTAPFARVRNVLTPKGRLLLVAASLPQLLQGPFQGIANGVSISGGATAERSEDLALLADLCRSGAVRPVIDCTFPLERIADAYRRADTGRKSGSIVVRVAS
jgi:NADPH:quinone reductase-like Zn-dependent oxidoreductase